MDNVAFLVDGHLEQRFVQRVCPGKPVRRLNCNGRNVSAEAIAKRVATQCRLMKGRHYPIVVWVDLEDRPISYHKFIEEITNEIHKLDVADELIIGVADRCIENWIIADSEVSGIAEECDGFNGKNRLSKSRPDYHETTVGVELLTACHSSRMIRSPSFAHFREKLPDGCWWLDR